MKILELNLKKKVLIVDAINEKEAFDAIFEIFNTKNISDYKFLCKGSDLTEEIASELVETHKNCKRYIDYTIKERNRFFELSIPSFISAVGGKGFYWLENPIEKPANFDLWRKYGDYTQYGKVLTENSLKWQEAEEKTFRNPLIFVKNYENKTKCYCGHTIYCDCSPLKELKQETLEEAAERLLKNGAKEFKTAKQVLIEFAKWQQEQSKNLYSEEEVYTLLNDALWDLSKMGYNQKNLNEWFEQFKKK